MKYIEIRNDGINWTSELGIFFIIFSLCFMKSINEYILSCNIRFLEFVWLNRVIYDFLNTLFISRVYNKSSKEAGRIRYDCSKYISTLKVFSFKSDFYRLDSIKVIS